MTTALLAVLLLASADAGPAAVWLGPKPVKVPSRVVTIAPSLTQTVLALGKGGLLVGVSRFDEAPEVAKLKRVGGFNDPSIEAVVALKADLVLVQMAPANQKPVEKMAELGIPVLALPLTRVDDVLEATVQIGAALGAEERAKALVAKVHQTRAEVRARAKTRRPLRVLIVYGFAPLVVAGPGSFVHELLLDTGATNVAQASPSAYPVFSAEAALVLKPDVVVDVADVDIGKAALQALPGLKQARWVKPPSKDLLQPGPALQNGLLELEALLYPR
ncbi:MAG: hemin transporter substrate-binding protein [Myxococcaceae bacterium]|nr:hemin transporter substrate-binding protein [Myxococcaceae bacterium]